MKKYLTLILLIIANLCSFSQKNNKIDQTVKTGEYLYNTDDLYFFDVGINCYLKNICKDIDSVYETTAQKVKFSKDTTIKVLSYLITDNYQYVYTNINKHNCWLRTKISYTEQQLAFLKVFLKSEHYDIYSTYVQVIPFKNPDQVFLSTTDDWYICDISNFNNTKIGTKGGRVQDCQMVYNKDCVKCNIVMGWEEEIWYNSEGKKINKKK
mgnify:CR=1 FL=1